MPEHGIGVGREEGREEGRDAAREEVVKELGKIMDRFRHFYYLRD